MSFFTMNGPMWFFVRNGLTSFFVKNGPRSFFIELCLWHFDKDLLFRRIIKKYFLSA